MAEESQEENMKIISCVAPVSLHRWLNDICKDTGLKKTFILRKALELYISKKYPNKMPEGYKPLP